MVAALLLLPPFIPDASEAGSPKRVTIADPSDWDMWITYQGTATQKAMIKLRSGAIYSGVNALAGNASLGDDGLLYINFHAHPKVAMARPCSRR